MTMRMFLAVVSIAVCVASAAPLEWEPWREARIVVGNEFDGFTRSTPGRIRLADAKNFGGVMLVPQVIRIPERNLLMLMFTGGNPERRPWLSISDDEGENWSDVFPPGNEAAGITWGLTYYGNGVIAACNGRLRSTDFGKSWQLVALYPDPRFNAPVVGWDPDLVLSTGDSGHIITSGYYTRNYYQAEGKVVPLLRESHDGGKSWSPWRGIPEFPDVSEIAFGINARGEVVAALRSETVLGTPHDHFSRLEYSISTDGGRSWQAPRVLQGSGRHHPSLALLPDGRMVMSYVVRMGYADAADGASRYGIEAVVSNDGGHTWDTRNRYVLTSWEHHNRVTTADGAVLQLDRTFAAPQGTSTVWLPEEEMLLTFFGTGENLAVGEPRAQPLPRQIGMIKWKPLDQAPEIVTSSPAPPLTSAECEQARSGFATAEWGVVYVPAVLGRPGAAWTDRYPPGAVSLVEDGGVLRLDHRFLTEGMFSFTDAVLLESNRAVVMLDMVLKISSLPDPLGRPWRLTFYAVVGSGPEKFPLELEFDAVPRLVGGIFGTQELGVKPDTFFRLQVRVDRKARRAQLWVDGRLVADREIDVGNRVAGETPATLYFGYGTPNIGGVTEIKELKFGFGD